MVSRRAKGALLCSAYLFGSTRLPLQDSLCCFIVLVSHRAGEGRHPLTVANAETNVGMRNEELYDDVVLVADGGMDRGPAFCILAERNKTVSKTEKKSMSTHYLALSTLLCSGSIG